MPIKQTNTFTCEKCGHTRAITDNVDLYDDPVIYPPNDCWGYVEIEGEELFLCPGCNKKREGINGNT